jgi:hypothetical protein
MLFENERVLTEDEQLAVEHLIRVAPLTLFQRLNLILNTRGLCMSIDALEEVE